MAFNKVNPPGWSFGAKLTSAQMNQLDADHANALDKSTANDSILGTVSFSGAGKIRTSSSDQIEIANGNALIVSAGSGIVTTGSGSITAASTSGINTAVANGIVPLVAGGISDGGVTQGIKATVFEGIVSNAAGGIIALVAGGIADGVAEGITVSQPGGLVVSPGSGQNGILIQSANSWIGYQVPRSTTRNVALAKYATGWTGWSMGFATGIALVGGATTNVIVLPLDEFISGDVNGSTLNQVTVSLAVKGPHSALPTMPFVNILRQPITAGASAGGVSLYSGGTQQFPTPANAGAWDASSLMQVWTTTPNQNNVIDRSQYLYYATLQDEGVTNGVAGNQYFSVGLRFGSITNSAPG